MKNSNLPKVAYFCMEYGLKSEVPIYAGGLGILAGDYLKGVKDLAYPALGIGILWRQDYTQQYIGEDGRPYDEYPYFDYSYIKDTGKTITVRVRGEEVVCKIRLLDQYGNAPLYLLDTNFEGSNHGWMTSKLYGGSDQDRIAQEIILGVGGVRLLRTLGIEVDVYHFNEGHAVFAGLELIREKLEQGLAFEEALASVKEKIVFTTHTPVEAGNEIHNIDLLNYMEASLGLSYEQLKTIGEDPFNMTKAALRLARKANAVSKLHTQTAEEMWSKVEGKCQIISITNGVHQATWQNAEIKEGMELTGLREVHQKAKQRLIDYIKKKNNEDFSLDKLTIGFARRAASYKRADLIFHDFEAIDGLLRGGQIQLVFSGKAHPNDENGKDIIARIVEIDKSYHNSVVFLENYDMNIASLMIEGCDVWLNTPLRPLEASGTSGMKAALNGVLNLSIADGWAAEGILHQENGWIIDELLPEEVEPGAEQDYFDAKALYRILEEEVIPTYYHDQNKWLQYMQNSIKMAEDNFTAARMVQEYYQKLYS